MWETRCQCLPRRGSGGKIPTLESELTAVRAPCPGGPAPICAPQYGIEGARPRPEKARRRLSSWARSGSQHLTQPRQVLFKVAVFSLEELEASIESDDVTADIDEHDAFSRYRYPPGHSVLVSRTGLEVDDLARVDGAGQDSPVSRLMKVSEPHTCSTMRDGQLSVSRNSFPDQESSKLSQSPDPSHLTISTELEKDPLSWSGGLAQAGGALTSIPAKPSASPAVILRWTMSTPVAPLARCLLIAQCMPAGRTSQGTRPHPGERGVAAG